MTKKYGPLGVALLLAVFLLALGVLVTPVSQINAQTKGEICDNGLDDDDDKLVDCADPDCATNPACQKEPPGEGCSPGFWKNHPDEFNTWCGQVSGWTCDELWTAINCKGNNATCRRSEAADALNAVSGCTE
jgi:hypothetical protein